MSFILDALKKSESERQRQSGPALFEVKVAPPRGRFAPWAVLLGALLMVNLVIVAWLALRSPKSAREAPSVAASSAAAPASTAAVPPPPANAAPIAPAPSLAANPSANATASTPSGAPAEEPRERSAAAAALNAAANGPARAAADPTADAGATADDYAPAVEPPAGAARSVGNATRATDSGLPTYQDAASSPGATIPELRLDLHVFAANPADRFVFINMTKLREGEALPQGVHVENITPDGAILSYQGRRFVLMRE